MTPETYALDNGHVLTLSKKPRANGLATYFVVTETGPNGEYISTPYMALSARGPRDWAVAAQVRGYGIHPDAFEADGVTLRR